MEEVMEHSNTNGIIHSLFLEYTGRKSTLLDSAVLAKASTDILKPDEKVYALISIVKLYVLAGFTPKLNEANILDIVLVKSGSQNVEIETQVFTTEKDKAVELLKAVAYQSKFENVEDKKLAVYQELKNYYSIGKDFNSILNNFCSGKNVSDDVINNAIKSLKKYIKEYVNAVDLVDKDNLINIVMSEVLEDLEEIKINKI